MPAGRPRANDDLYEEIRNRIEKGEPRRTVVEDVARRHSKNPRSLNSQFSVWANSLLPGVPRASNLRLVAFPNPTEIRARLEVILAEAEQQLADADRRLAEMNADRQALAAHVRTIQEALTAMRGKPLQTRKD